MSEVILHLSPPQKKAIEDSGLGNLLKINKIHIYRDLCNEIARRYDKEKKAFNINGQTIITLGALREAIINSSSYDDHFIRRFILFSIGSFICPTTQRYVRSKYLNLVDDVDKMRELNWSSLTLNQLLKGILKFRENETNIEGNVVDDIRGTINCNEIPDEKAHDNDSETRSNEDFLCTSEEVYTMEF
uniref:Aminotransferase-like plant mobile domain-containing protein n=1 Tax=Oryza glumipatula TaxID=40148 RepID=A0A0E0AHX6_9ORYZ